MNGGFNDRGRQLGRGALALALCLLLTVPLSIPTPARAAGGAGVVVAIVGIVVGVVTTAVATAAALSDEEPDVKIDDFNLAAAEDFNVGDHATINLRLSVSYGAISDYLSGEETGTLTVRFYADGRMLSQKTEKATGEPVIRSYTFKATAVGLRPGSSEIHAEITLRGQIAGWIDDDWIEQSYTTSTLILNVGEPFEVFLTDPAPAEVLHGEASVVQLKAKVRSEFYYGYWGTVQAPTLLDGKQAPFRVLPAAANAGASYETFLMATQELHEGCKHRPPHPPFVNLRFEPNQYTLQARFSPSPYTYDQIGTLPPLFAKDVPFDPPDCDPEVYDPKECACVPANRDQAPEGASPSGPDAVPERPPEETPGSVPGNEPKPPAGPDPGTGPDSSSAVPPAGSRVVLTGEVVAGDEATLAVTTADGVLLGGVVVEVQGQEVTTGPDGRATFLVPVGAATLLAVLRDLNDAPRASARVLESGPAVGSKPQVTSVPRYPVVGSEINLEGGPFSGAAAGNRVQVGDRDLEVLAASPAELLIAPPLVAAGTSGPLTVTTADGTSEPAAVTFVQIRMEGGEAVVPAGTTVRRSIVVEGTSDRLRLEITNLSPTVVSLVGGDSLVVRTSGGTPNTARIRLRGRNPAPFVLNAQVID